MLRDLIRLFPWGKGKKLEEKRSSTVRGETWHMCVFKKAWACCIFNPRKDDMALRGGLDGWAWRLGRERSSATVLPTLVVAVADVDVSFCR